MNSTKKVKGIKLAIKKKIKQIRQNLIQIKNNYFNTTINSFIEVIKQNQINVFLIFILSIVSIVTITLLTKVASYSVFFGDDFVHYTTTKEVGEIFGKKIWIEGNKLHNALSYALQDCLLLGGRYFAMFLQIFIGPTPTKNVLSDVKTIMIFNTLLWFISFFLFIYSLTKNLLCKLGNKFDRITLSIMLFSFFVILCNGCNYNFEDFTLFCCAASYTIPTIAFMFSLSIFLEKDISIIKSILFFILVIMAQGGNVEVSVFNVFIVMVFCMIFCFQKRIDKIHIVFLFHYMIFAMISILAPGNFNRKIRSGLGKNIDLFEYFIRTKNIIEHCKNKIFQNNLIFLLIIIFAIMIALYIYRKTKNNFSYIYIIVSVLLLFLPYPLAFLQSIISDLLGTTERANLHINIIIIINTLNFFIILSYIVLITINKIFKNNEEIILLTILFITCSIFLYSKKININLNKLLK